MGAPAALPSFPYPTPPLLVPDCDGRPASFITHPPSPQHTHTPQTEVFRSALKRVDVTFQNLDSSEISLTDVSHYYDSDPTKVWAVGWMGGGVGQARAGGR